MLRILSLLTLVVLAGTQEGSPRFVPLDIYVESSRPLAAYQIELICDSQANKIVGVEGGDVPEYREAPFYDPAALTQGRIIIAAFTLGEQPPVGRTRVARIHMQETREGYQSRLVVAATVGGEHIDAHVEIVRGGNP